jgi:Leucine-rich repeat (LRR) protein
LGTAVDDETSLLQRYVLGSLWFLQPTTSFGSAEHAATWATNIDECEWSYVRCNDSGRVTALLLADENIRGQIPHDLGLLTDLTILSFVGNQLSGIIPSFLGALTALHELLLNDNQLVGTIPSSLGALSALTRVDLSSNQLTGTIPSSLGTLTALTSLWLYNNQLSGSIPSSLITLTTLANLLLNDNQLVGTMPFCNSRPSFEYLVADCVKVNCTCCTHCCPAAFGNIPVSLFC